MAPATEAPASSTAEGPTQHTQNQASGLSPYQLRMLHSGINPNRVRNLRGLAHLEAWDVRRQLIRVFGFGGFSIETLSLDLVHNHGQEGFRRKNKQGEYYGEPFTAWTVVYRAQVRLTIFDPSGREISHWEDGAAGDAVNQPSVGDAHDMAMKTSLSQAVKRCATNLGDQFGLSLYNDGSRDAVVCFSAAHPPQEWKQVEPPQPEPEDPPVRPEQDGQDVPDEASRDVSSSEGQSAPVVPEKQPSDHLTKLLGQAKDCWKNATVLAQIKADGQAHEVLDEQFPAQDGTPTTLRVLLDNQIAGLREQAERQRAA